MSDTLKENLDIYIKTVTKKDKDCILIIDGAEGAGKSVMAQQVAYYFDKNFTLNDIIFKPMHFKKAILNAPKHKCIVWDEARSGLSARRSMSIINNVIIDMLAEIRQRNLFIIIVMPTFFDMDRNVALWRSMGLINVYFEKDFKRGQFKFFNYPRKNKLYILGKKNYSYGNPRPNFIGRFNEFYTVDEKEYRQKKFDELRANEIKDDMSLTEEKKVSAALMSYLNTECDVTYEQIAQICDMRFSTIAQRIRTHRLKGVDN